MRYQVGEGSSVLVEVDEDTYGVEAVSRTSEGVLEAGQRLESALASVRDAAQAALDAMSKLSPETVEVEFGIKLAGEAGALIAKTSAEGHFTVKAVVVSGPVTRRNEARVRSSAAGTAGAARLAGAHQPGRARAGWHARGGWRPVRGRGVGRWPVGADVRPRDRSGAADGDGAVQLRGRGADPGDGGAAGVAGRSSKVTWRCWSWTATRRRRRGRRRCGLPAR